MKEDKEDYIPKFKLGQAVKYIGNGNLLEFSKKKKNVFYIDEIINYNTTKGYFPQMLPIKSCYIEDKGECYYLIDERWQVPESDLEAIKKFQIKIH